MRLGATQSAYLARQQKIACRQAWRNWKKLKLASSAPHDDTELRIACFLDWSLVPQPSHAGGLSKLEKFLGNLSALSRFSTSSCPGDRRFALCLILLPALAFADALPEVVSDRWQQCRVDSDYDIVRDACRSCGTPSRCKEFY